MRLPRCELAFVVALLGCVWIEQAPAAPAVFWFNDPVEPDDSVLVTGADLGDVTGVTIRRIADREAEPAVTRDVTALQPSGTSLKFTVPTDFPRGIYQFTLRSPGGSASGYINRPTIYWVQGSLGAATTPAGTVQLFGRNIVRRKDLARLRLTPAEERGAAPITAILEDGDLWRAKFAVPAETRPGLYRLHLSNGDGGEAQSVDAGPLWISAAQTAADRIFDVRAYGANGDGKAVSTRGVVAAIAAAESAGGGTVYFPRGRYLLLDALVVPPNVVLKGERTDLVNLVWPDFTDPPPALIKGTRRFAIEDLTIYASNHRHVVAGGFADGNEPSPGASDIAIRRVRIRASAYRGQLDHAATVRRMAEIDKAFPGSGPDTVRLSGDRLELTDCDIMGTGRSLFLFKATDAVIARNILVNGRYGWYSITGSRRIIFEANQVTAGDLQGNGGGINTISNSVSASDNIFVGHNTFRGFYGGDREAMTTDGSGGYYYGNATSDAAQRLLLRGPAVEYPVSADWTGAAVMVVDGRGAGQSARVAQLVKTANPPQARLDLDRPLTTELDATSVITVVQAKQNFLVIDNQFEDCGVAAQSYGTGLNHIFAGNTSNRTGGFFAIGLLYAHFQPSWQIQLLGNRIGEGNVYRAGASRSVLSEESAIGVHAYRSDVGPGAPPLASAIVVRGNRLEQDAHIEIKSPPSASPGVRDVIIEANVIGASRIGLSIDRGAVSTLERNNIIERRLGR